MTKPCIICGCEVDVSAESEIVTCQNEHCQLVVENSIGTYYEVGSNLLYSNTKTEK